MSFSFANSFNTQKLFNIDTTDFEYQKLEELWEENSSEITDDEGNIIETCDKVFKVYGIYINDRSEFGAQPIIALEDRYVNLPEHLYKVTVDILNTPQAIKAINAGKVGFKIETYYQKKHKKTCYTISWVDM